MFVRRSSCVLHRPLPGVERREAVCGKGCQMVEFQLKKGSAVPPHQHSNEQIGMVVSGAMIMKVGDEETTLSAGDGYAIPPGVVHSVEILEDAVAIDVFSPPREDYRD